MSGSPPLIGQSNAKINNRCSQASWHCQANHNNNLPAKQTALFPSAHLSKLTFQAEPANWALQFLFPVHCAVRYESRILIVEGLSPKKPEQVNELQQHVGVIIIPSEQTSHHEVRRAAPIERHQGVPMVLYCI